MQEIKIPLSKVKMIILLLGCAAFVFIGVYILFNVEQMQGRRMVNPFLMRIVAVICILFFGIILVALLKKIVDKKAGVILSDKGIMDNSGPLSVGWIVWEDILQIRSEKVMSSKFILIEVKDPQKYISMASSKFKGRVMATNYKKFGAPISISANGLAWNFTRVEQVVLSAWANNQPNLNQ